MSDQWGLDDPSVTDSDFGANDEALEFGAEDVTVEKGQSQVKSNLTDLPVKIGPFDTGLNYSPSVASAMVGLGRGMGDTARGLGQIMHESGSEFLQDAAEGAGYDPQVVQQNEDIFQELLDDEEFGTEAAVGRMAGFLADPVAAAVPIARGRTLAKATAIGAGAGAGFGAVSYVPEESTRLRQTLLGAAGGGVLTPALLAVTKGVSKLPKKIATGKLSKKAAEKTIQEMEYAYKMQRLGGLPSVDAMSATQRTFDLTPAEFDELVKVADRKPQFNFKAKTEQNQPFTWFDKLAEPISDTVRKRSPKLANKLMDASKQELERSARWYQNTEPYLQFTKKLPKSAFREYKRAALQGEEETIKRILRDHGGEDAIKKYDQYRTTMDEIYDELTKAGHKMTKVRAYHTRHVEDLDELYKSLPTRQKDRIEKLLDRRAKKLGRPLSKMEQNQVINNFFAGVYDKTTKNISAEKGRKVHRITDDMIDAFSDPKQAVEYYIRATADDLAYRKLIGRQTAEQFGGDINGALGKVLKDEWKAGKLGEKDIQVLKDVLTARFTTGLKHPHKWLQSAKNLGYSMSIGNPRSALVQGGDAALVAYKQGVASTLKSVFGKKFMDSRTQGLISNASQEFASSTGASRRFMDISFKYSGFRDMDRVMKDTAMTAAIRKFQKRAKTSRGRKEIMRRYGDFFEDDLPQLVDDLKKGELTDRVKLLAFSELADTQPITLSELPVGYLNHPNGRVLYMLRSFTLKHLNLMRKEILREARKGSKARAAKNATRLITYFTGMNMGMQAAGDFLSHGETATFDEYFDEAFLQNFVGLNRYTIDKFNRNPTEAIGDFVAPPYNIMSPFIDTAVAMAKGNPEEADLGAVIKSTPIFGELMYNWMFYGTEEWHQRREQKAKKEWKEEHLGEVLERQKEMRRRKQEREKKRMPATSYRNR